jgi:acid phosphatase
MAGIWSLKLLPFMAGCAFAGVQYPEIPTDLTTPFQQRLAVYGPDGKTAGYSKIE